jgi:hypothetical protein
MPNPTATNPDTMMTGKTGDGYARITQISAL